MQLNSNGWPLRRAACAAVLMLAAAGCSKGNAAGSAAPAADAGGAAKSGGYVLITRLRPEAPEKFRPQVRAAYVTCADLAKMAHRQVVPFPVLPPDFVTERTTYASDGKRTMVRTVSYDFDPQEMTPDHACEVRIKKGWNTGLIAGGQLRSGSVDEHGQVHVGSGEAPPPESPRASRMAMYTASKRINGTPLKCSADDNCIVDPAVALVAQGRQPVLAAYRNDDPATYGTALIREPVSLTVGKPIDPAVFDVEKGE
jgi:hypothetical protein